MALEKITGKIWIPKSNEAVEFQNSWIKEQIKLIGEETLLRLSSNARDIRERSYSPYSGYSVGAAVLGVSGRVYFGVNAEVATYTGTDHAETSAITGAIIGGEIKLSGVKFIKAIAVSHLGKSGPCGGCRQKILEHADNALVIDVSDGGEIETITSAQVLFPFSFTPKHLKRE